MINRFKKEGVGSDNSVLKEFYGYRRDVDDIVEKNIVTSKLIYAELINKEVYRNNSVVHSRSEKRSERIKWRVAWRNYSSLRGVNAELKIFAWKLQQDLLPLGARLHRPNVDRRCMLAVSCNVICEDLETREHAFIKCEVVSETFNVVKTIIIKYLGRNVTDEECIFLAFNHRDYKKRLVATWFAVTALYAIYQNRYINGAQILLHSIKELDWNLELNRKIGSRCEMMSLKSLLITNMT